MEREFVVDFLGDYSQASLIQELKRIQKLVGDRSITKADIDKYGKASWSVYFRKFGSFTKALLAADLSPSRRTNVTNEELIGAVVTLWTKTLEKEGRRPLASDLKKYGIPYSQDTYRRRFGNWRKVLIQAYDSVDSDLKKEQTTTNESPTTTSNKTKRKEPSIRTRFLVFKRDHFACVICGRSGVGIKLEIDHRIPLAKGGADEPSNMQTLCFECNRGKRTDTLA